MMLDANVSFVSSSYACGQSENVLLTVETPSQLDAACSIVWHLFKSISAGVGSEVGLQPTSRNMFIHVIVHPMSLLI